MNILIGYGYHPNTTATYMQRSLEKHGAVTFVGTPYGGRPGFEPSSNIASIAADLPEKPDLYLHVDSGAAWYFPLGLSELDCPTACYLIDVHIGPKPRLAQAMFFDYVFTAQRDFVEVLRAAGHPQVHWLPLGCDPEIHRRYDVPKKYDIGFVGSFGEGYTRRRTLLEQLAQRYSVSDYKRSYTPFEMARVYSESRLVFNCTLHHEVNMRVFEGTATGSLTFTDRIGNGLSDLFVDGTHLVMYDDDTLLSLAEQYLKDASLREHIAQQGYEHARAYHTYDHRVETLMKTVFDRPDGVRLDAPLRRSSVSDAALAYTRLFSLVGRFDDALTQGKRASDSPRRRLVVGKELGHCLLRRVKYG